MILNHFKRLFEYQAWANSTIATYLSEVSMNEKPSQRALELLSHSVLAEEVWYGRVAQKNVPTSVWETLEVEKLISKIEGMNQRWNSLLSTMNEDSLNKIILYTNLQGKSFETSVGDIMTHVVNHASYHRGQAILNLKDQYGKVPSTDFIAFARL